MATRNEDQYRNFRKAQRDAHTAVVQVQTRDVPSRFADWYSDLRRGRLNVFGGTLRLLDTLHDVGRDDLAVTLAEVVLAYAKDQADDSHGQAA